MIEIQAPVLISKFDSKSNARKNGYSGTIPIGWHELTIGKNVNSSFLLYGILLKELRNTMNLIDLNLFCRGLIEGRQKGELDDETVSIRAGALIEWLLTNNDRLSAKYIMRRFKSCFARGPHLSHYRDLIAKDEPSDSDFHVDMIVVESQLC